MRPSGLQSQLDSWTFPVQGRQERTPTIVRVATEIEAKLGSVTGCTVAGLELEHLWQVVKGHVSSARPITQLNRRDLKAIPWVLFFPEASPEKWLARDRGLLRQYRRWLATGYRAPVIISLVHSLLASWRPDDIGFKQWQRLTVRAVDSSSSRRVALWCRRCHDNELLHLDGPKKFASRLMRSDKKVAALLDGAGLSGQLAYSRWLEASQLHLLHLINNDLKKGQLAAAQLERAFSLIRAPDERFLRFENVRILMVEALLSPFEQASPSPDLQEAIRAFLLETVGDPRFRRGRWQGVDPGLKNVMMRWLVSMTLDDFFRILDKTAMVRHWRQRKRFWSDYVDQGVISDAWLVLGRRARVLAHRAIEGSEGYGRLGGTVDSAQSVLLMRLGGLTIAEWSHNGRCCFWRADNPNAPRLYRSDSYAAFTLRVGNNSDGSTVHDAHKTWMSTIARWIQSETGVRRRV